MRKRRSHKSNPLLPKLQPGDTVLVHNHTKGPFDPKYIGDYRIVSLKGNQVEVQPAIGGTTEIKHVKHVKYVLLTDKYINQTTSFHGLKKNHTQIKSDQIPDLHWKLVDTYHTMNVGQTEIKDNNIHDITLITHTAISV